MPILGLFGSGQLTTEQRPLNWREMILRVDPNGDAPITAFSSMMAREATTDPTFNWFYKGFEPRILNINFGAGYNAAAVTFTIGSVKTVTAPNDPGTYVKAGTLLLVPRTGEIMQASVDGTATTITVTGGRGFAGTVATALVDGDQITILGSAFAEGSGSGSGIARVPVHLYNYTQIFKTPIEYTRTAAKTKTRTGPQIQQSRMEALGYHAVDQERSVLFGRRSIGTGSNNQPLRTSGGLMEFVTTNVHDFSGNGTLNDFDDYCKELFKFGKMTRIAYVGNNFISKLNRLVKDATQYMFTAPIKVYGMELNEFRTPYGIVYFKRHPILTTDPFYTNSAWFTSPENMRVRTIDDTTLQEGIQANDIDGTKDQYLTEAGYEIHLEETFGRVTNL